MAFDFAQAERGEGMGACLVPEAILPQLCQGYGWHKSPPPFRLSEVEAHARSAAPGATVIPWPSTSLRPNGGEGMGAWWVSEAIMLRLCQGFG